MRTLGNLIALFDWRHEDSRARVRDMGNLLKLAAWEWLSADAFRALGFEGLRETYPTAEQTP